MKKTVLFKIMIFAAAATAVFSCHKDGSTAVYVGSLKGLITFDMPQYVRAGDELTLVSSGVYHPDGLSLGYYWASNDLDIRDTVRFESDPESVSNAFTFTIPDTLGTFSITGGAFASNYNAMSTIRYFTIVKPEPGGSLTGAGISEKDKFIVDDRDTGAHEGENVYYYSTVGNLDWFRNNLAYTGSGKAYLDYDVMSYISGRYYTYEEALTACPDGWRLPAEPDWAALGSALTGMETSPFTQMHGAAGAMMADVYFNGTKMWEFWPDVKITNRYGLGVIPAGYAVTDGTETTFTGSYDYAAFWTASESSENSEEAYYHYINVNEPDIFIGLGNKRTFAASVRCIRDAALTE